MTADEIPRKLPARTGKAICTLCLEEVSPEEYFRYDMVCASCAAKGDYPLASTDGGETSTGEPLESVHERP